MGSKMFWVWFLFVANGVYVARGIASDDYSRAGLALNAAACALMLRIIIKER